MYIMYIIGCHLNLVIYCIQATPSCTAEAKVEPFRESRSWALLSNSFYSSPPADLPEGLVGFTDHRRLQPRRLPHARLAFYIGARQPAVRRRLCVVKNLSSCGARAMVAVPGKVSLERPAGSGRSARAASLKNLGKVMRKVS